MTSIRKSMSDGLGQSIPGGSFISLLPLLGVNWLYKIIRKMVITQVKLTQ